MVGDVSSRLYDQADSFESLRFYEYLFIGAFQCRAKRSQVNDLPGFRVLYRHCVSSSCSATAISRKIPI
jgi:hypothetical protein